MVGVGENKRGGISGTHPASRVRHIPPPGTATARAAAPASSPARASPASRRCSTAGTGPCPDLPWRRTVQNTDTPSQVRAERTVERPEVRRLVVPVGDGRELREQQILPQPHVALVRDDPQPACPQGCMTCIAMIWQKAFLQSEACQLTVGVVGAIVEPRAATLGALALGLLLARPIRQRGELD